MFEDSFRLLHYLKSIDFKTTLESPISSILSIEVNSLAPPNLSYLSRNVNTGEFFLFKEIDSRLSMKSQTFLYTLLHNLPSILLISGIPAENTDFDLPSFRISC